MLSPKVQGFASGGHSMSAGSRIGARVLGGGLSVLTLCLLASGPAWTKATFTAFDLAGSAGTYADAINRSGTITGFYFDSSEVAHGFVRSSDGSIATLDVSHAKDTFPESINTKGEIERHTRRNIPFEIPEAGTEKK